MNERNLVKGGGIGYAQTLSQSIEAACFKAGA